MNLAIRFRGFDTLLSKGQRGQADSAIKIKVERMASSCKDIREDLIECVKRSDCMKAGDKTFHECVKDTASLDEKCKLLRTALYECRRGQLDMRYRFRGNIHSTEEAEPPKPISK